MNNCSPVVLLANAGIGDVILSVPALRALSEAFDRKMRLVCAYGAHRFLYDELRLERQVVIKTWRGGLFDASRARHEIGACDLFISLETTRPSPQLLWLLSTLAPASSIGFFEPFKTKIQGDNAKHKFDLQFDIVRALVPTAKTEAHATPPSLPTTSIPCVDRLLRTLPQSVRLLVVHNETKHLKVYPQERMEIVIESFLNRHPDYLAIWIGAMRPQLLRLAQHDRVIVWFNKTLVSSITLIANADLFCGVDSCLLHAADLLRTPGVSLFGPTPSSVWGFRLSDGINLQGAEGMDSIPIADVVEGLEALAVSLPEFSPPRRLIKRQ